MILSSGIKVNLKEVANIRIYSELSKIHLVEPLPPIFVDDDGIEQENVWHPLYADALNIFAIQKNDAVFSIILDKCVDFDRRLLETDQWKKMYKFFVNDPVIRSKEPEHILFLKNLALGGSDRFLITRECVLTEHRVFDIFNSITVKRDGVDILKANIRNAVKTNIDMDALIVEGLQLVNPLDEKKACADAGMDWQKWCNCEISMDDKASALALYRLEKIIDTHQNDAVQIESERKSKKK